MEVRTPSGRLYTTPDTASGGELAVELGVAVGLAVGLTEMVLLKEEVVEMEEVRLMLGVMEDVRETVGVTDGVLEAVSTTQAAAEVAPVLIVPNPALQGVHTELPTPEA
jgi:hypothetical protein